MAAELSAVNGAARGASVSLADLEKKYDRTNAVDGVSLDIRSGEFLTLLGPSGSGKTTTLMMIAGFETPRCARLLRMRCAGKIIATEAPSSAATC